MAHRFDFFTARTLLTYWYVVCIRMRAYISIMLIVQFKS